VAAVGSPGLGVPRRRAQAAILGHRRRRGGLLGRQRPPGVLITVTWIHAVRPAAHCADRTPGRPD
jgi:hypothetical protein